MKTIICAVVVAVCLSSCINEPHQPTGKETAETPSPRNTSINSRNAYSDLFIDSNKVEQFITQQHLNDTISRGLRMFYNTRNFEYAWFSSDGLTEQALAFRSLYDYSDSASEKKILDRRLDSLMLADSLQLTMDDPYIAKTELLFTWRFINYVWNKYSNDDTRQLALQKLIPAQKQDALTMAEAVLSGKDNQKIVANSWYPAMRERLKEYLSYTRKGGWAVLPPLGGKNKKIKPGISNPYIALVKKRLQQTGQFTESDTSMTYTAALEASVKKVQATHGLKPDGIITSALIDELNIPAAARLQQLLVNMERMRWMPATTKGKLILVNIPEFILHARDGSDTAFNMNIVAGKEGHSTVMFSGSLNQIVFSPYWNLPQSIVEKEVLPGMEKNNNYLEAHDMEITGKEDGIPVIRQLPGEKNELGKVKFLFPNSFNIYFHDTPHKELFSRTNRAFSHGCIRLGDPKKMAQFLLQDQQKWTSEKIDSAMNSGKEQFVQVKEPVPVLIYYYTTWVDDAGNLQWRKDIYGHDGKMARKLFFNPQVIGGRTLAMVAK